VRASSLAGGCDFVGGEHAVEGNAKRLANVLVGDVGSLLPAHREGVGVASMAQRIFWDRARSTGATDTINAAAITSFVGNPEDIEISLIANKCAIATFSGSAAPSSHRCSLPSPSTEPAGLVASDDNESDELIP
jgi:hypothetical protein